MRTTATLLALMFLAGCPSQLPAGATFAPAASQAIQAGSDATTSPSGADAAKQATQAGLYCGACKTTADCGEPYECSERLCRKAITEVCASECAVRLECTQSGACTPTFANGCIPSNDADCAASSECAAHGKCHYMEKVGQCGATTDADCAAANICANMDYCHAVNGACH